MGKEVISNPTFVAMIRAIVLALISMGTLAEEGPLLQPRRAPTAAAGFPTCLCLTKLPLEEKSCTYDFAPEGLCFQVVGLAQNFTLVPASFGESCAIHYDPHQACSDLTKYPPEVKPISLQADYCMRKWCYVDPCNCDASDASKSDSSLASLRTPMAHAATRTRTPPQRAQPTLWGMLNAQQQQSLPAMPILSRWALACCLLGWVPSHEL